MASLLKEVKSSPIEIDLGANEVNNRDAKKATILRTRAYKPAACNKTRKHQKKLASIVWTNFNVMEPNEESNPKVQMQKTWQV